MDQSTAREDLAKLMPDEPVVGDSLSLELIWMIVGALLLVSLVLLLYLLTRRWWINRQATIQEGQVAGYQSYLAEFMAVSVAELFTDLDLSSEHFHMLRRKDLRRPKRRALLANEIYQLAQNLSGIQLTAVRTLFLGLGFYEDTEQNLRHRSTARVIRAIREVRIYRLTDLLPKVEKLMCTKNESIQLEGMLVCLELSSDGIAWLEKIPVPLNNWMRHKILYAFQRTRGIQEAELDRMIAQESVHLEFYQELKTNLFPSEEDYLAAINQMVIA